MSLLTLLRRRGGFDPRSIPGLALWLDASRLALNDLDPVGTWPDLSGNGRDANQATTAKKPVVRTNVQNGKPVVRFDGTDDNLVLPNFLTLGSATVFVVVNLITLGTGDVYFLGSSTTTRLYIYRTSSSVWGFRVGATAAFTGAAHNTNPHLFVLHFDGAAASAFVDGTSMTPQANTTTGAIDTLTLGAFSGGASGHSNINMMEVLTYTSALSTANRQQVERYLGAKWGITVA